jgi:hypothetical protein
MRPSPSQTLCSQSDIAAEWRESCGLPVSALWDDTLRAMALKGCVESLFDLFMVSFRPQKVQLFPALVLGRPRVIAHVDDHQLDRIAELLFDLR